MSSDSLQIELEELEREFAGEFPVVAIRSTGSAAFLVLENGRYAAEIYKDGNNYVVDPAIDDTLQGEIKYSARREAVGKVRKWLRQGNQ